LAVLNREEIDVIRKFFEEGSVTVEEMNPLCHPDAPQMPIHNLHLSNSFSTNMKKQFRWLDIGSGTKTGGAPTLAALSRAFRAALPDAQWTFFSTDNLYPLLRLEDDGTILESEYVFDESGVCVSEVDGNSVSYRMVDSNEPSLSMNDVMSDDFMQGEEPFDYISVCMVLHHLTGKEKPFKALPLSKNKSIHLDSADGERYTKLFAMTEDHQEVVDRLLEKLAIGGTLFLNFTPNFFSNFAKTREEKERFLSNARTADTFYIIEKVSKKQFIIHSSVLTFKPFYEKYAIQNLIEECPLPQNNMYFNDGIASVYPQASDAAMKDIWQLFADADKLAYYHQSLNRGVWEHAFNVTEIIRQKGELTEMIGAYLAGVPDDNPEKHVLNDRALAIVGKYSLVPEEIWPDTRTAAANTMQRHLLSSLTDDFLSIGLSHAHIEILTEYTLAFLYDSMHEPYVITNARNLLVSLANPNVLSIDLMPVPQRQDQTRDAWFYGIYDNFSRFHRDYLNAMPHDIRQVLFSSKLGSAVIDRAIKDFLERGAKSSATISAFVNGLTLSPDAETLVEQGVLVDVEDFSSSRGFSRANCVYRFVLKYGEKQLTLFYKGIGENFKSRRRLKGNQVEKYETLFYDIAHLLGLRSILAPYYDEKEEGGERVGFTLMEEIPGLDGGSLFDVDEDTLSLQLRRDYEVHERLIVQEYAQWAALSDLMKKGDRVIVRVEGAHYPANYMVDMYALDEGLSFLFGIDHGLMFNDKNSSPRNDLIANGDVEMGILRAFSGFDTIEGRNTLFALYEEAYFSMWQSIDSRSDAILATAHNLLGADAPECLALEDSIRNSQALRKQYFIEQKEALCDFWYVYCLRRDAGKSAPDWSTDSILIWIETLFSLNVDNDVYHEQARFIVRMLSADARFSGLRGEVVHLLREAHNAPVRGQIPWEEFRVLSDGEKQKLFDYCQYFATNPRELISQGLNKFRLINYLAQRDMYDTKTQSWEGKAVAIEDEDIDVIVVFSSPDRRVPEYIAENYLKVRNRNPNVKIFITGLGSNHWTDGMGEKGITIKLDAKTEVTLPEAVVFRDDLCALLREALGDAFDPDIIGIDPRAEHVGKNVEHLREAFETGFLKDEPRKNVLLLHSPLTQRRGSASLIWQYDKEEGKSLADHGIERVISHAAFMPTVHDLSNTQWPWLSTAEVLGEMRRLIIYQPDGDGFIGHQNIPTEVIAAYLSLRKQHAVLMPEAHALEWYEDIKLQLNAIQNDIQDRVRYSRLASFRQLENGYSDIHQGIVDSSIRPDEAGCVGLAVESFHCVREQAHRLARSVFGDIEIMSESDGTAFDDIRDPLLYTLIFKNNRGERIEFQCYVFAQIGEDNNNARLSFKYLHSACCVRIAFLDDPQQKNFYFLVDPASDNPVTGSCDHDRWLYEMRRADGEEGYQLPPGILNDELRIDPHDLRFENLMSGPISLDEMSKRNSVGSRTVYPELAKGHLRNPPALRTRFVILLLTRQLMLTVAHENTHIKTDYTFDDFITNPEVSRHCAEALGFSSEEKHNAWRQTILDVINDADSILEKIVFNEVDFFLTYKYPSHQKYQQHIIDYICTTIKNSVSGGSAEFTGISIRGDHTFVITKHGQLPLKVPFEDICKELHLPTPQQEDRELINEFIATRAA